MAKESYFRTPFGFGFLDVHKLFDGIVYDSRQQMNDHYHSSTKISSHDIMKFIESPRKYYMYKIENKKYYKKSDAMVFGTTMDDFFFDYDVTKNKIQILENDIKEPSSPNMKVFSNNIINNYTSKEELSKLIIDSYKKGYKTSTMTEIDLTSRAKDLYKELKGYIKLSILKNKKPDNYYVTDLQNSIMNYAFRYIMSNYYDLFWDENPDHICLNGVPLEGEIYTSDESSKAIFIRGMPDYIRIDTINKKVTILDMKTTSTFVDIFGFSWKKEIYKYQYDIQLAMYKILIEQFLENKGYIPLEFSYSFKHLIISNNSFFVTMVEVSSNMINNAQRRLYNAFEILNICEKEDRWDIPNIKLYD